MRSGRELGCAAIELEEPAEALVTLDLAATLRALSCDQIVVEPLMIALAVKVSNVFRSGSPKRSLPEEDESVEALLFD
jgi:hypothetical protein